MGAARGEPHRPRFRFSAARLRRLQFFLRCGITGYLEHTSGRSRRRVCYRHRVLQGKHEAVNAECRQRLWAPPQGLSSFVGID